MASVKVTIAIDGQEATSFRTWLGGDRTEYERVLKLCIAEADKSARYTIASLKIDGTLPGRIPA